MVTYYEQHKERAKQYYQENKEKIKANSKAAYWLRKAKQAQEAKKEDERTTYAGIMTACFPDMVAAFGLPNVEECGHVRWILSLKGMPVVISPKPQDINKWVVVGKTNMTPTQLDAFLMGYFDKIVQRSFVVTDYGSLQ